MAPEAVRSVRPGDKHRAVKEIGAQDRRHQQAAKHEESSSSLRGAFQGFFFCQPGVTPLAGVLICRHRLLQPGFRFGFVLIRPCLNCFSPSPFA